MTIHPELVGKMAAAVQARLTDKPQAELYGYVVEVALELSKLYPERDWFGCLRDSVNVVEMSVKGCRAIEPELSKMGWL